MICVNCKNVTDCINPPTNPFHCAKFVKVEKAKWICDHIPCSDCRIHSKCYGEDMGMELWSKWLQAEHPKGV